MRIPPQLLLRSVAKFVAVVAGAGLAGALIGIGLAALSGDDDTGTAALPATTAATSTSAKRTQTKARSTSTATTGTTSSTSTSPEQLVYRIPRVQVLSARLEPVDETTERALVAVRVRVTNRGLAALRIATPVLLAGDDEVRLGAAGREAARRLRRPLAVGSSATGTLRFAVTAAIAQRLSETPSARLRVARRTVSVTLATSSGEAGATTGEAGATGE